MSVQGGAAATAATSPTGAIVTGAAQWTGLGTSMTNADGRCLDLLSPDLGTLQPGIYQIAFETKEYFERTGRKSFYPFVQVTSSHIRDLDRRGYRRI